MAGAETVPACASVPTGVATIVTPPVALAHSGKGSGSVGAVNTTLARPSLAVVTSVNERRPQRRHDATGHEIQMHAEVRQRRT